MARLPVEPTRITRDESGLPEYDWRGACSVPWCEEPATDPHHVVRRSHVGGPEAWIVIDGNPIPNVAGVCRRCHDLLEADLLVVSFERGQWYARMADSKLGAQMLIRHGVEKRRHGRCPTCARKWPKPNPYTRPTKARDYGEYKIRVPDDSEDGGAILRELLGMAAEAQGFDDTGDGTLDYYALVGALHSALTGELATRPKSS